jgi:hypothetical protein
MFTTFKVRKNLGANDYRDPGWYRHPKGTWPMNGRAHLWMPRPAPDRTGTAPGAPPCTNPKPCPRRQAMRMKGRLP